MHRSKSGVGPNGRNEETSSQRAEKHARIVTDEPQQRRRERKKGESESHMEQRLRREGSLFWAPKNVMYGGKERRREVISAQQ